MHSVSFISAAPKDIKYKFSYVKLALKFVKGRIETDSSFVSNEKIGSFFDLYNSFRNIQLNENISTEQTLDSLLDKIGNWFRLVKINYLQESKSYHENCKNKMKDDEQNIAEFIFETQQGSICRNATEVL